MDTAYFAENWKYCNKIILKRESQYGHDMTRQIALKIILKYYFMTWHAKLTATVRLSSFKMRLSSFTCTVPWVPLFKRQTQNVQIQTHSYLFIYFIYIYFFSFWFKRDRTYQLVGYSYFCRYLQNNLILERELQVLEAWTSNFNYIPCIFSTKKKLYIYIYKGFYYRISTKEMFDSSF